MCLTVNRRVVFFFVHLWLNRCGVFVLFFYKKVKCEGQRSVLTLFPALLLLQLFHWGPCWLSLWLLHHQWPLTRATETTSHSLILEVILSSQGAEGFRCQRRVINDSSWFPPAEKCTLSLDRDFPNLQPLPSQRHPQTISEILVPRETFSLWSYLTGKVIDLESHICMAPVPHV